MTRAELIASLKTDGKTIGEQAKAGSQLAQQVIDACTMWQKCPGDSAAQVITEAHYQEWKAWQNRKVFRFKGDFTFSAEDIDDAFARLSEHFTKIANGEDSNLLESGEINIERKSNKV